MRNAGAAQSVHNANNPFWSRRTGTLRPHHRFQVDFKSTCCGVSSFHGHSTCGLTGV
jgi:hypothetical protein